MPLGHFLLKETEGEMSSMINVMSQRVLALYHFLESSLLWMLLSANGEWFFFNLFFIEVTLV